MAFAGAVTDSPANSVGRARGRRVAEIIKFRSRADICDEGPEVDLLTAVDAAIRDLKDILAGWGQEESRRQAEECRLMLERAFDAAI